MRGRLVWSAGAMLAGCALLSGCASWSWTEPTAKAPYQPDNVFVWSAGIRPTIKRVALLPLAVEEDRAALADGRDALEPVLRTELAKARRFELYNISPELLRRRTGRAAWGGEEPLPPEFFTFVQETAECDAVLFSRLTVFRGYAPLAVGWRLRLVDARTHTTLWAADEVFDAGDAAVRAGARHYLQAGLAGAGDEDQTWALFHSPRQFGQYTAAQLAATLPNP